MNINLQDGIIFDSVADYFEPYRVSYPRELIDYVLNAANIDIYSRLLEIGSGTGKATELLAPRGFNVLCVEPGVNFVDIARKKFEIYKGINFSISKFEEFEHETNYFDLIYSAQAFHWLEQPIGFKKCADLLKPGGHLALFWNLYITMDNDFDLELQEISNKWNDLFLLYDSKTRQDRVQGDINQIENSGYFHPPSLRCVQWDKPVSMDEMMGFTNTTIVYTKSTDVDRKMIMKDIERLFEKHGNVVKRTYYSYILLSAKKDHPDS